MEKYLKFCMITTFYPPYNFGGDGIFIYRLSNELAERGHHVEVIHCIDAYHVLRSNAPTGNFPHHQNVKVHRLKSKMGFLSPFLTHQTGYPFLKGKKIRKILAENNKFNVIHFHNISLVGGPGILRYGKAIKLYTTHEHWLLCPLSVLWKFNNAACVKKSCFLCTIRSGRPPQLWRYSRMLERMSKNVDAFISPSQFTIKKHHDMGLEIPFVHIPNFLSHRYEEKIDDRTNIADPLSRPYFLFVGRLEKSKGAHIPIRIFQHFKKSDLLVVGDGQYGGQLRKLAEGFSNVKFLGKKSHKELKSLYQNATAVIVPSLCYEVFGIIILEAFAMKTPVIVNNTGALPELVKQSGGGFIYNNDSELIKAMESLIANPALCKELGEKGYQAYKKYWTEESHLEKYFNLIYKIAGNKKKKIKVEKEAMLRDG